MPKIANRLSVTLSIAVTLLCLAVMTAVHDYTGIWFRAPQATPSLFLILFTYAELLFAYAAAGCLLALLFRIRKKILFAPTNTALLRALSWCCFAEALLFLAEAVVLPAGILSFSLAGHSELRIAFVLILLVVAFACAFMGLILRVVKNAFAEAASLKDENDYTI